MSVVVMMVSFVAVLLALGLVVVLVILLVVLVVVFGRRFRRNVFGVSVL